MVLENRKNAKRNIVIAGGSSGYGHIQAGKNIINSIKSIDNSAQCEFINIFDFMPFHIRFILEDLWKFSSLHLGSIYRVAYNSIVKREFLYRVIKNYFASRINEVISELSQKSISVYVATHPAAAVIGSIIKHKLHFLFCVVPTDFVLHNFHFYPEVDFYYLPQDYKIVGSTHNSSSIDRISLTTGIPLSPDFCNEKDHMELYRKFGLLPEKLTILISFGGKGLGAEKHIDMLRTLMRLSLPLQFMIMTGENVSFRKKLQSILSHNKRDTVKIFGFRDDIAEMMTISDIFIGKAGGLSLSEALAKGLPIAIIESLPGQEDYNTDFIMRNKLGIKVNNDDNLIQWLHSLLSKEILNYWQCKVRKFGRPYSGLSIANHIINSIKPAFS